MTINIITPTFNDCRNLPQTADSIIEIKKNRPDISIFWIVMDNMSTDNTYKFLNQQKYKDVISVLVIKKDKGIYDAMNNGLDLCIDGHVLFLGAGDKILRLPKTLETETVYYGTTIVGNNRHYVSTLENYCVTTFGTLHHQSMLTPVAFHRYFNINYKVCADYAHNIEMLLENRLFKFSDELLAYHMPGGISSNLELVKLERKIIQKNIRDYIESGILLERM